MERDSRLDILSMDASHLQPADASRHHPEHDLEKLPVGPMPNPQGLHVENVHHAKLSTAGRSPELSGIGLTMRPARKTKTLVLCFDGTGNRFHGDASDSNILKIFRMLDRSSGKGFHYYQPGIGTYVAADSLGTTGSLQKLRNWYVKVKDAAIGTSFDQHVVGGYKFLMQYYSPGDSIYMFGFSRGSYTARFLAEMIDWVGLITHGNEEMIQFAWRTFSKWKAIDSNNKEARREQRKAYEFMVSFRETFSRPVRRIKFLGLFDTVNSVPRFENAMLSRQRIPFSAISSAKIIRHAVSIDERRAKFRADLLPQGMAARKDHNRARDELLEDEIHNLDDWTHRSSRYKISPKVKVLVKPVDAVSPEPAEQIEVSRGRHVVTKERTTSRYRGHSRSQSHVTGGCSSNASAVNLHAAWGPNIREGSLLVGVGDAASLAQPGEWDDDYSSDGDEDDQDIEELWFPGGHADIGGGWDVQEGDMPLSHIPLVWIVREAKKSGLAFDEDKMEALNCLDDTAMAAATCNVPSIDLPRSINGNEEIDGGGDDEGREEHGTRSKFKSLLIDTSTKGMIHDCLRFGQGLPAGSVLRWRIMEWLPFRRLDLTDEGTWKPIRW